jgi:hypothetical protein
MIDGMSERIVNMGDEIPPRLSRRARGRDWPVPGVVAAFAATRASSAAAAHLFTAVHLLVELMAVPGTYRFLSRRGRLSLVGVTETEWVAVPLPDLARDARRGHVAARVRGDLSDIVIGRRGLISGRVVLSGQASYVPRRQHVDLAAFMSGWQGQ